MKKRVGQFCELSSICVIKSGAGVKNESSGLGKILKCDGKSLINGKIDISKSQLVSYDPDLISNEHLIFGNDIVMVKTGEQSGRVAFNTPKQEMILGRHVYSLKTERNSLITQEYLFLLE